MNKEIKKILFSSVALAAAMSPLSALAVTMNITTPNDVPTNIADTVSSIITGVVSLMAIIAVLFLILGGIMYLTSSGDEAQVEKAKNTMTYALMGLFIAALAYAAVNLMIGWLV